MRFPTVRSSCQVALLSLLLGPALLIPGRASGNSDKTQLNAGYSLLHHFSEDVAKVPLLLTLKNVPSDISSFTTQVSQLAQATNDALEQMKKRDPSLQINQQPLSSIESEVRDAMQSDKSHQIVFRTNAKDFAPVLLAALVEDANYALNLTKVLAEHESDSNRIKTLNRLSDKWLYLRNQGDGLLRNY